MPHTTFTRAELDRLLTDYVAHEERYVAMRKAQTQDGAIVEALRRSAETLANFVDDAAGAGVLAAGFQFTGDARAFASLLKPSTAYGEPAWLAYGRVFWAKKSIRLRDEAPAGQRRRSAPSTSDATTERVDADCERIVNVILAKPAAAPTQAHLLRWVNTDGANHGAPPMTRDTLRRRLVKISKSGLVPVSRLPKLGTRAAE